jgi:hypothetical protein
VERGSPRPGLVRHPQQVAPVPRPLLGELVAGEEGVNQSIALLGAAVGEEAPDLVRGGRQTDGVQVGAPDEFFIGREAGVGNAVLFDAGEKDAVDEIPPRNAPRS